MMSYPNPTPPSSVPTDVSTTVTTVAHHASPSAFAFTGADVTILVIIAVGLLVLGAMALATWRYNNEETD